nr:hypothetical protein Iba_chr10dCG15180 [Ipomoea batatas]GME20185.1 hypothetical protein Iba_scaffold24433CG0010 [Ipomoea batatas]
MIGIVGSILEFELQVDYDRVSGDEIGNGGGGLQVGVVGHSIDGKGHEQEKRIFRPPCLDRGPEKRHFEHVLAEVIPLL